MNSLFTVVPCRAVREWGQIRFQFHSRVIFSIEIRSTIVPLPPRDVLTSHAEKDQAEEALNAAKKERDRVKSEMDELTKFSELDLGHHGEFFGLYKSTLEFRNKE